MFTAGTMARGALADRRVQLLIGAVAVLWILGNLGGAYVLTKGAKATGRLTRSLLVNTFKWWLADYYRAGRVAADAANDAADALGEVEAVLVEQGESAGAVALDTWLSLYDPLGIVRSRLARKVDIGALAAEAAAEGVGE